MAKKQSVQNQPVQAHIFCKVIDNHGDAGVSWRLARQLASEHGVQVTLIIDRPDVLVPMIGPDSTGEATNVAVCDWQAVAEGQTQLQAPDLLIETFGCELPPRYMQTLLQGEVRGEVRREARGEPHEKTPPLWLNLEYLSAEDWVAGCHGLKSPHPQYGLDRVFFFPGFGEGTGGLLREGDIIRKHALWQADAGDRQRLLQELGVSPALAQQEDLLLISLFTYESAALESSLRAWSACARPVLCLVPEGRVHNSLARLPAGLLRTDGLEVKPIPFRSQPEYDRLLSHCDLNLVRGEDSFVRAQWAGKPLLWHIYEQEEGVHLAKLEAFLVRYLGPNLGRNQKESQCLEPGLAEGVRDLWLAWNRGECCERHWAMVLEKLPQWHRHARRWREKMARQKDLASNLMNFYENRL